MSNVLTIDGAALLSAVTVMKNYYPKFEWESQVWANCGHRRNPYRVLVLFGLSARTNDALLVRICRDLFQLYPSTQDFMDGFSRDRTKLELLIRKGQVPFVESLAHNLSSWNGTVARDREALLNVWGVGPKIAECVVGYGWGEEALPIDSHGCRVVNRILGKGSVDTPIIDAVSIRGHIKTAFATDRRKMEAQGIAMVDVHEILRLHGQNVCTIRPKCWMCPVSSCMSRATKSSITDPSEITGSIWQAWRELILEPLTTEPV